MLTSCFSFVLMTGATMPFKWLMPDLLNLVLMVGMLVVAFFIDPCRSRPASKAAQNPGTATLLAVGMSACVKDWRSRGRFIDPLRYVVSPVAAS